MVKEVIQVLLVRQVNKASQVLQEKKVLRYDVALGNKLEGTDKLLTVSHFKSSCRTCRIKSEHTI